MTGDGNFGSPRNMSTLALMDTPLREGNSHGMELVDCLSMLGVAQALPPKLV
jgi:hypothetical protein